LFDLSRKQIKIGFGLFDSRARFHSSDHRKKVVRSFFASFLCQPGRRKERLPIILPVVADRILKTCRQNAHYRGLSTEIYLAADDVWIAAEAPLPKGIAENDDLGSAGFVFVTREDASEHRLNAQ